MEFANVGRQSPSTPDLHVKARSQANPSYPQRFKVDDEHVPWAVPWDEYEPTVYTDKVVLEQNCETRRGGWADPPVPPKRAVIETRGSHELQSKQLPWVFDDRGRPLNPRGRTGMSNRGVLGKWGPNHAGDAIVTRYRRRAPGEPTPPGASSIALEMVAIKRRDTGEWAIPGGMADPSEIGKAALMREFREEVGAVSADELARFDTLLHELFADSNGRVVYRGYVDDPRNVRSAQLPRSHSPPHRSSHVATALPTAAPTFPQPSPLTSLPCRPSPHLSLDADRPFVDGNARDALPLLPPARRDASVACGRRRSGSPLARGGRSQPDLPEPVRVAQADRRPHRGDPWLRRGHRRRS